MTSYALGIDCGNTAVKAALFDENGVEIATVANNYPTHIPKPDYTEADLDECWGLCADAIRRVMDKTKVDRNHVVAVGCSGHGNGLYLLDTNRAPLLGIKSLDSRAQSDVERLQKSNLFSTINRKNHQGVWSSQTALLLHWLKRHQRETYEQIGEVLFCKDYLNFKLTGECATEWGDITASGLFDFESDSVSDELLGAYDIADIKSKLPNILESNQVIGGITSEVSELTGLNIGTPVIAGLFDVVACAYGSEAYHLGETSVVAGTWNINQVVTDTLPPQEIFMGCKLGKDRYLAIEASTCSASNLEWLVQRFFTDQVENSLSGESVFERFNRQLEDVELNDTLPLFHPYLYGSTGQQSPSANLFGLKGWHQDIHIVYAFYEGIVFAHLEHINRLRSAGYKMDSVSISGGASRSDYWCQLFADILNAEVKVSASDEVGAKGVAMLALSTVSELLASDLPQTNKLKTKASQRIFRPSDERHEFYVARFKKYCVLKELLAGV
ncbi:carbohydrate kinase [Vibrio lamellibrachiae]|uniref:FGGY-family carbohydrate kinase n=1 Tax=Vibrio lamellibrachiae TaxID=2910253 RepID=UPI003D0C1876